MPGVEDVTVSVELPELPEVRVTVDGLRDAVDPEGRTEVASVTVPENPLRLARLIVDVPEKPD